MVIGFKPQFVEPILQGSKVHTIREDEKGRWKPGMTMHMYTGGRYSKEYRQFAEKQCTSIQLIRMWLEEDDNGIDVFYMVIESERETDAALDCEEFAKRDGFDSLESYVSYWRPIIEGIPNRTYVGKIIHWTDLKY